MADSKRQRLVDAIKTRMATILVANGYATNLGQNVEEWATHIQQEDVPAAGVISVCDLPAVAVAPDNRSQLRYTTWQMPVQFRIFLPKPDADTTMAANVRTALKDVNRAIRQDDRWKVTNVGLAKDTMPQMEGPLIVPETFEMQGGIVEILIEYFTEKFNAEE